MDTQEGNTIPEIWKAIPDWPGYEVSDQGQVRSYWRPPGGGGPWYIGSVPKVLQTWLNEHGYPAIHLAFYTTKGRFLVHRLILATFVGPCPPGQEGCHEDGIRTNCFLTNLRWDTRSKNHLDKRKHGTTPNFKGENHPQVKLTEVQVLQVRTLFAQGTYSKRELGKLLNIHEKTIGNIVLRRSWKHLP